MRIEVETQEELTALKNKALKVKIIALDKLEKDPLSNTSYFTNKEKRKLLELMTELFTMSDEEINNKFNTIVNEDILSNGKDVSNYPVYYKSGEEYLLEDKEEDKELIKKSEEQDFKNISIKEN
jgi:hypothetical protein